MRVLIVNRYMSLYGGAEQLVVELSRQLSARNIANEVLTLNISNDVVGKNLGMKVITAPVAFPYALRSTSLKQSLGVLGEIYHLRRLVQQHYRGFDLINLHNFPASWAAFGCHKPVVWMCNEIPDFYNNPAPSLAVKLLRVAGINLDTFVVNRSVDIICVADSLNAKAVKTRYHRESVVIPYGIDFPEDFSFFDRNQPSFYEQYGLGQSDFLLLQVGVISPTKNQKDSIDAFMEAKTTCPNAKLVLAGPDSGPYADFLRDYVAGKGLEKDIIFTGRLAKEEVRKLYSICNVGLFPVKLQGGYLAVLEAVSFGLPVIVYPSMGASEFIKEKKLGIVSDDLAGHIRNLYRNYSLYKEKAIEASRWVRRNVTWEKFSLQMIDVFNRALKGERV